MKNHFRRARLTTETLFWRHTASLAGVAVRHRRTARVVPVLLLAAAAFVAGRLAGHTLISP
jgi:hypothetical protein